MRLSFETSNKQIALARERNKSLSTKDHLHILLPDNKLRWYVQDNHPSVIGSHIRNINLWTKPTQVNEVWSQHSVVAASDGATVTIDYIVDVDDNRFISVLKEYPIDKIEPIMSISYHGDRVTFSQYLRRMNISEEDFIKVAYYTCEDYPEVKPWESRNEHLISTYQDGNLTPLLNNMMRIFNEGFKYAWTEEDDELVEMYNEHINQHQVERLMKARSDYTHLVNQLAAPIASAGLLELLADRK